jgi:hypothetical protein
MDALHIFRNLKKEEDSPHKRGIPVSRRRAATCAGLGEAERCS